MKLGTPSIFSGIGFVIIGIALCNPLLSALGGFIFGVGLIMRGSPPI